MSKNEAIENLYLTFRRYTTANMHHCDCGCIDLNDVKKLASKKLRDLEEDDFSSYHGSALYTWGDLGHYKHFLPRILEVHNQLEGKGLIGLFEIKQKFEYAKWRRWEQKEIKAIEDFIQLDFIEYVNERVSEVTIDDLATYSYFVDFDNLIKSWKISKDKNGLRNFVYFFYEYGNELINSRFKINDKNYSVQILKFIKQSNLVVELERTFFAIHEENKVYAEKISIVLQMIEQGILKD